MREAVGVGFEPGAAGLSTARAAPAGWDLLLVLTAGLLLVSVARIHVLFPALSLFRPALVFGGLATVVLLLDTHPLRRLHALASPTTFCVAGLLAWAVLGLPFAFRPGHGFSFLHDSYAKALLVGLVVAGSVRRVQDVERLVLVYFVGAAVYAAVVLQRFDVGGDDWRLMALFTYDPNDFATYAVTAMPFGIYFLSRRGGRVRQLLAAAGLLALGGAFVRAGSRGGFLALLVVVIYLVLRYRTVPKSRRLLGVGLVLLVIVATAATGFWERMGTLLDIEEDYNATAMNGRLAVWERGMGYLWDRPILGLGIANFGAAEGNLSPQASLAEYGIGVRWTPPHNSFVQVAAELGLPGIALFVGIFWTLISALARVERRSFAAAPEPGAAAALAPVLTASLIGFAVGAFFLSLAYSDMLYALVGLGVGLWKVSDRPCT